MLDLVYCLLLYLRSLRVIHSFVELPSPSVELHLSLIKPFSFLILRGIRPSETCILSVTRSCAHRLARFINPSAADVHQPHLFNIITAMLSTTVCLVWTAFLLLILSPSSAAPATIISRQIPSNNSGTPVHNDYLCRSTTHPNPVVLLHGLGATYYEDLNYLEEFLQQEGFCTFSLTYGDYPEFPYVGGLISIDQSAPQIASFMQTVKAGTGASKLDIVGHSEGAFQSLYVPKFEGVSSFIDKIVAISPPTHGTTFANLYNVSYIGGNLTRDLVGDILDTVGCAACNDLGPGGPAVVRLNDGNPIVQPGNNVTIMISKDDELVTPNSNAFVDEAGVENFYIQQYYPNDVSGHIGEAYDQNVWNLVVEWLSGEAFTSGTGNGGGITYRS